MQDVVEPYNLSYKKQEVIWRKYWINKLGYFPAKMEKIAAIVTWKEKNENKEQLEKDYKEFVNKYLNDSVFRTKLK